MFLDDLQKRFQDMQTKAGAQTVFGDVIELNGRKVIPVASVRYAFGIGGGQGPKREEKSDRPGGGGGGGGMRIDPVAVIEISEDKLKVQPIVNVTRLAIAGIFLFAWTVFWVSRTVRRVVASKETAERLRPAAL